MRRLRAILYRMTTRTWYDCLIGTYTRDGSSEGIYAIRLDPSAGMLVKTGVTPFGENPSFLALHHGPGLLFSVQEIAGDRTGQVTLFELTRTPGGYDLTPADSAPSSGRGPCHLFYDHTRRRVVVANYTSGTVGVLAVDTEARRIEAIQRIVHTGKGTNPERQEGPHAHSVTPDPTGTRVVVCDLGLDEVIVYAWNRETLMLEETPVHRAGITPGGGPRHFAFHPNGRFGFVAHEMGNRVTAFAYSSESGELTEIETRETLPAGYTGENTTADIHIDPDGHRLYVSNRGHDSIAVFTVDADSGAIAPIGHIPASGRTPRNFAITPDGRYLLAANQDSDSITAFDLAAAGFEELPDTPIASIEIPKPVCIRIA